MTALNRQTRELLSLIRQALDLPFGATGDDNRERRELRHDNATRVVATLACLLDTDSDVSIASRVLRQILAEHPITYATESHQREPGIRP